MAYITMTGQAFDSLADLAQQMGTEGALVYVAYASTPNDRGGGSYRWSDSAVNTADGVNFVQVGANTGRWVRMRNNNYNAGTLSFNVSLGVATYTVAHGLPYQPTAILLEAISDSAAIGNRKVSNINTTTFTITFGSTLGLITGAAQYYFMAIR